MQFTHLKNSQHSLFNALNRFITAATVMDETVMVPSFLRDLPADEEYRRENKISKQRDMHDDYLLLMSIKNDIESGISDEQVKSDLEFIKASEEDGDLGELQQLFHHHLNGIYNVFSKLTLQTNHLTNCYTKQLIFNNL
ncbi:mid1-interacting protein 1-B-like [Amblyraja radiata]|uniref:mid1-interacting protein 1-B-like n=1 Tax=Amblyraja radiata TaxID=386614 RepID=UPI001403DCA8|nr:mid1-interacting protein 1-B-like [Amblyraja radiata]